MDSCVFLLLGSEHALPHLATTAHRLYEALSLVQAATRSAADGGYTLPAAFLDATPGRTVRYLHTVESPATRCDIGPALQQALLTTPATSSSSSSSSVCVCALRTVGAALLLGMSFHRRFQRRTTAAAVAAAASSNSHRLQSQPLVVVLLADDETQCSASFATPTTTVTPIGDVVCSTALLEMVKAHARFGLVRIPPPSPPLSTVLSSYSGSNNTYDEELGAQTELVKRLVMMAHSTANGFVRSLVDPIQEQHRSTPSASSSSSSSWSGTVLACLGISHNTSGSTSVGLSFGASLEERQKWAILQYTPQPIVYRPVVQEEDEGTTTTPAAAQKRSHQHRLRSLCSRCMAILPFGGGSGDHPAARAVIGRCPFCMMEHADLQQRKAATAQTKRNKGVTKKRTRGE